MRANSRMTSDDTPSMSIHALLVATRNNIRMTMRTSQWPTKEQLPIPPSRAITTDTMPEPITLLNPFPAIWTNCLVVSCPNKRESHDKHKDYADYANRPTAGKGKVDCSNLAATTGIPIRISKTKVYPTTVRMRNWRNCRLNVSLSISASAFQCAKFLRASRRSLRIFNDCARV